MKKALNMRDQIDNLREMGELVEVNREADWNLEIPAFNTLSGKVGGPAFLFNNVKDCPGWRVLAGHFNGPPGNPTRRLGPALGMGVVDYLTLTLECSNRLTSLIKPIEVASAPCKEVKIFGKDVNLLKMPFCYHAIGDSAKYTFHSVAIYKDPDAGWQATGQYCTQIYSARRLTITPYAHAKIVQILGRQAKRNLSLPIAIALTAPPALYCAAVNVTPAGTNELEIAGAYQQSPMEVVKAETSDLLIPAEADVIIEGEIRPYEFLPEGPKLESFAFSVGPRQPFFAIRVNCITMRKNPILAELNPAPGVDAGLLGLTFPLTPGVLGTRALAQVYPEMMVPVKGIVWQIADQGGWFVNISLKKPPYPEYTKDLLDLGLGAPVATITDPILLLDDNVDPFLPEEIFEAWHTQTNPGQDWKLTEKKFPAWTIVRGMLDEEEFKKFFRDGNIQSAYFYADATTKGEPPLGVKKTEFETLYPEELQKWVVENWARLGTGEEAEWKDRWLKLDKMY